MGLRICISNKFPRGSDAAENNQALACCGANQLEGGGKETQTDGCECSQKGERKRTYQNIQQKIETRKEVSNCPKDADRPCGASTREPMQQRRSTETSQVNLHSKCTNGSSASDKTHPRCQKSGLDALGESVAKNGSLKGCFVACKLQLSKNSA